MKLKVTVKKDSNGRLTQLFVRKGIYTTRGVTLDFEYGVDGFVRNILFSGRTKDLPSIAEIVRLINQSFIERIGTIQEISKVGVDIFHDRGIIKQWLHGGSYTERWEQGFRKELYHGRTGAYYATEPKADFEDWTPPEIITGDNTLESAPWNDVLRVRNSIDGVNISQLYVGFPKAHHRMAIVFNANFPATSGGNMYIGVEVNSGGSFAFLACFASDGVGGWALYAVNWLGNKLDTVTLRHGDVYSRYVLVYDPPYLRFYQAPVADAAGYPLELTNTLDLGTIQGKGIPFIANEEPTAIAEFRIGNIWIYELSPSPIEKSETWTDPALMPYLICNVAGRQHVEVWARSINAGKTVLVQGSQDGTTFRDIEELTTVALNGINQIRKCYENAYRYIRAKVEDSGTGTISVKISTSAI